MKCNEGGTLFLLHNQDKLFKILWTKMVPSMFVEFCRRKPKGNWWFEKAQLHQTIPPKYVTQSCYSGLCYQISTWSYKKRGLWIVAMGQKEYLLLIDVTVCCKISHPRSNPKIFTTNRGVNDGGGEINQEISTIQNNQPVCYLLNGHCQMKELLSLQLLSPHPLCCLTLMK